jgi:hypothetical protein
VIADLGVHHVEGHVLRCGYTMNRITHDYGIDLAVTTYTGRGEVESGAIWMQVKATDHLQHLKDGSAVTVRVERRDVLAWVREPSPVILVLYDAAADRAYWLHIQGELQGGKLFETARAGTTLTLHFPTAQVVNEEAIREFRRLKMESLRRW